MIYFFDEDNKIPDFNSEFFRLWLSNIESNEDITLGDISFIFQNNSFIRKMNIDYLNHDYDTDVITFDYSENNIISGDIFINIDFVQSFSSSNNIPFNNELSRIIIHGVLHLCGYNDKSSNEKDLMTARENFYLSLQ